jgi:plasmid stabilization system protein ParE
MSKEVIRSSPSERDVAAILSYFLEQHAEDAGQRFVSELQRTFDDIAAFPHLGHPWESSDPRDKDLRYCLVHEFNNYLVFYRVTAHGILIKRVFHGSQDIASLLSSRIGP